MPTKLSRRHFLAGSAATLAASSAPLSNLSFAAIPSDKKLVFIQLRGGLDQLALFPPMGDPDYHTQRGSLALPTYNKPGAPIRLTKLFGLHPMAEAFYPLWMRKELAFIPAAGLPIADGSHFSAQEILESGYSALGGDGSGWLGRALSALGAVDTNIVHFGDRTPLILQTKGGGVNNIQHQMEKPSDGLAHRLNIGHKFDTLLAPALNQAIRHAEKLKRDLPQDDQFYAKSAGSVIGLEKATRIVGQMMTKAEGHNVAVLETAGWDTHQNQGSKTGMLARRLAALSAGIEALAAELGDEWANTVVIIASEFGRSVKPNDLSGTDNGNATAVILAGGAVAGRQVSGFWPGLEDGLLDTDGALKATVDMRAVFKSVLRDHLGLSRSALNATVFPDSTDISPLPNLIR